MLPKAHLTSHSRSLALGEWSHYCDYLGHEDLFLYSSSVYSVHLFLISSASVRSIPFLSFIDPIFAWNVPLVSIIYAPTSNTEEAEAEWFYEDLQDLLELTPKKDVLFIIGDWNAKLGHQETPGVKIWTTEWSRARANSVLPRECTGHSKHPLPTTQEKILHMDITR